jgi:hypothetical protein
MARATPLPIEEMGRRRRKKVSLILLVATGHRK